MASPNVKADKSAKIRRRNTLPGPLYKIRHQSALLQKRHTNCGGGSTSSIVNHRIAVSPTTSTRWSHLHQSKTNPYVGWFRHAPSLSNCVSTISLPSISAYSLANVDALWLRDWLEETKVVHKKKRFMIKDHSFVQFKYQHDNLKSALYQMKKVVGRHGMDGKRDVNVAMLLFYKRRHSGHLRGGGTENDVIDDATVKQYLQNQYSSSSESITLRALSRIASWLLDVPLQQTERPTVTCKVGDLNDHEEVGSVLSNDEDDDDETRSEYSYDNHDTFSGSRYRTTRHNGSFDPNGPSSSDEDDANEPYREGRGLSSQAEAYYALGAVYRHILAETTSNGTETLWSSSQSIGSHYDGSDRLDYEITQMDIVRMNRIASRHLDVESIVRLPILTYELKNVPRRNRNENVRKIPTITEEREDTASRSESRDIDNIASQTKNDTESSWMIIPHMSLDKSFDSTEEQLDRGDVNSIEWQEAQDEETRDTDNDLCVICLDRFIPGDRIRVLPCNHSFHVGCIDRWLSGSHSFFDCYTAGCPTCKVRPDTSSSTNNNIALDTPSLPLDSLHNRLHESDGSVPSWALARIGHILAHDSQHF